MTPHGRPAGRDRAPSADQDDPGGCFRRLRLFWCGEDKLIYRSEAPLWHPQWALQAFAH